MHILLSGASGFLGSACVDLLSRLPEIELSVVRSSQVECVLPLGSREILLPDVQDRRYLERALSPRLPTHIIHVAALSSPSACENYPELAARANVDFTNTLLEIGASAGAHVLVTSTDLVFDGAAAPLGGFSESDEPNPISVYSCSKFEAENLTRSYQAGCVVRLSLLYGHTLSKSRGVLGWMEEQFHARQELALFKDEFRTPVHVADAAHAIVELSRTSQTGLFHCGGPERMSRVDFGVAVAEALGYDSSLVVPTLRGAVPTSPARPADVSLNSELLAGSMGFSPRRVRDALRNELSL